MRAIALALICCCFAAACAHPDAAPARNDAAARGLAHAEDVCAACHAVTPGQDSTNLDAPPFEAIANTPGMTRLALSAWLGSSHPSMPNLIVTPDQADDLWAYLETLKQR